MNQDSKPILLRLSSTEVATLRNALRAVTLPDQTIIDLTNRLEDAEERPILPTLCRALSRAGLFIY